MNKRTFGGLLSAGVLLFGIVGATSDIPEQSQLNSDDTANSSQSTAPDTQPAQIQKPTCDGMSVTSSCALDGVNYTTYVYHPAVPEKSHTETVTTYQKKIVGHCTLCVDGTYSPSCATGSGACSWHGGVAEWNAPKYASFPVYTTKTIIDAPFQEAFIEKVVEQ